MHTRPVNNTHVIIKDTWGIPCAPLAPCPSEAQLGSWAKGGFALFLYGLLVLERRSKTTEAKKKRPVSRMGWSSLFFTVQIKCICAPPYYSCITFWDASRLRVPQVLNNNVWVILWWWRWWFASPRKAWARVKRMQRLPSGLEERGLPPCRWSSVSARHIDTSPHPPSLNLESPLVCLHEFIWSFPLFKTPIEAHRSHLILWPEIPLVVAGLEWIPIPSSALLNACYIKSCFREVFK